MNVRNIYFKFRIIRGSTKLLTFVSYVVDLPYRVALHSLGPNVEKRPIIRINVSTKRLNVIYSACVMKTEKTHELNNADASLSEMINIITKDFISEV